MNRKPDDPKTAYYRRLMRNARRRHLRENAVRDRNGPILVRCWVCRRSAWRVRFVMARVAGRVTKVRDYGRCPATSRWGGVCRGSMHRDKERVFVLRAALDWDRRGMNCTSEFDR